MAINTINFEHFDLKQGNTLLDVGCGLGRHSLLAYRNFEIKVVGVDLGLDDLRETQNRFTEFEKTKHDDNGFLLAQANGYKLPFADGSFDRVMCSEVLEHVPEYPGFIAEMIRVLKPGGRLALSVPKYFPEKVCWIFSDEYKELAGHVRIFQADMLVNEVEASDLRLTSSHSEHAYHSPYWWLRSMFFSRGDQFYPVKQYKKFMDWQLITNPEWTNQLEKYLNPVMGKSNVYYFDKPEHEPRFS